MSKGILLWTLFQCLSFQAFAANDSYLWLEGIEDQKSRNWVIEQNARTNAKWASDRAFEELRENLTAVYNSKKRLPVATLEGEYWYNYWRDENHPRGIWRRTTKEEYQKANPRWETVLDIDQLARREKENWVFSRAVFLKPNYTRCLVLLSRGGADAVVVREFEVVQKKFVEKGFALPEAKTRIQWASPDSVIVGTDFGSGSLTKSGYPRFLKRWHRRQQLEDAVTILQADENDVSVGVWTELDFESHTEVVFRRKSGYAVEAFVVEANELIRIKAPLDATVRIHRNRIFILTATAWNYGDQVYGAGTLLVGDLKGFLASSSELSVLYQPSKNSSLTEFVPTLNHVLINELVDVRSRLFVASPHDDGSWTFQSVTPPSEFRSIRVTAVDPHHSDEYSLKITDYLTPETLEVWELGAGKPVLSKSAGALFDAEGLEISQHWVKSKDGTAVPYFQVGPKNPKNLPTVVYGYGGFNVSQLPRYMPHIGKAWLERGGVFIVANIRGGGEFGPSWHTAALRENRVRSYEDFIAVAEDVTRRGVTTKQKLGALGASNGGLLVGNMLTMRPDLFGAVICQAPLLDMSRYHKLLAGASWMAEYGNPDNPDDWKFIREISPYHNVKRQEMYPPVLFVSSTRDDRTHPGHARKMVAKMRDYGHEVYYYEMIDGGHGGSVTNSQRGYRSALGFRFFWRTLNQDL